MHYIDLEPEIGFPVLQPPIRRAVLPGSAKVWLGLFSPDRDIDRNRLIGNAGQTRNLGGLLSGLTVYNRRACVRDGRPALLAGELEALKQAGE